MDDPRTFRLVPLHQSPRYYMLVRRPQVITEQHPCSFHVLMDTNVARAPTTAITYLQRGRCTRTKGDNTLKILLPHILVQVQPLVATNTATGIPIAIRTLVRALTEALGKLDRHLQRSNPSKCSSFMCSSTLALLPFQQAQQTQEVTSLSLALPNFSVKESNVKTHRNLVA